MVDSWQWLRGTFWIVPEENLAAPLFSLDRKKPLWLSDQTVWQITDSANGYFWGKAAVRLRTAASGAEEEQPPAAQLLTGSITPEANVHMTFIPLASSGNAQGTVGIGHMRWRDGQWMAEMQMSSPLASSSVLLHWACYAACGNSDGLPSYKGTVTFTGPATMGATYTVPMNFDVCTC